MNTIYNLLLFFAHSKDITNKIDKIYNVKLHKAAAVVAQIAICGGLHVNSAKRG